MKRLRTVRSLLVAGAIFISTVVGEAHEHIFESVLSGSNEAAPNLSLGIGTSTATLDLDLITLRIELSFSGLSGNVTGATLYGPTAIAGAGTASAMSPAFASTSPAFPTGVTAGSYDFTFDLTVASGYNLGFINSSGGTVSGALNALDAAFGEGKVYLNIQTTTFPTGEVRGFFVETPEPESAALLALGSGMLLRYRKRIPARLA